MADVNRETPVRARDGLTPPSLVHLYVDDDIDSCPNPHGLCTCLSFITSLVYSLGLTNPNRTAHNAHSPRSFMLTPLVDSSLGPIQNTPYPYPFLIKSLSNMIAYASVVALLASATFVHAQIDPSAPGPGDVFKQGEQCTFTWNPDTTGTWKETNVELMTGNNLQMIHLTSTPPLYTYIYFF